VRSIAFDAPQRSSTFTDYKMPNITIDYTSNLEAAIDPEGLVRALRQAAVDTAIFPTNGIRVFARPVHAFQVASGDADEGFIQIFVRVAPGRDEATRKAIAKSLFATVERHLDSAFATQRFGCQLEVQEFGAEMTARRDNLDRAVHEAR
jgi:5-carboxymethyl-2-hydroxymuconate isomerase